MPKPKHAANARAVKERRVVEPGEPADPTVPLPSSGDPDTTIDEEHRPSLDGGVRQHPIHDSDADDRTPEDFEEESTRRSEILPDLLPEASDGTVPSER